MRFLMRFAKKIVAALFLTFLALGFGFSDEVIEEDLRFEINLSDTVGTRLLNFSNCTDLGVDITTRNNKVGGRIGFMFRELWLKTSDRYAFGVSFNPYLGFSFYNGCVMGGIIFFPGIEGCAPYVGFNWDIDLFPIKNGFSNSLALRLGIDWYPAYVESDDPNTSVIITVFGSVIPNLFVGGTYKFGYGMKTK